MYTYKQWHINGWVEIIHWLHAQDFVIVLSGGSAQVEKEYADRIIAIAGIPIVNLIGQLTLGETTEMIRRAKLFIGPDTSVTHIAAACGTPTIALFGPTDPVRWGPWPYRWPADSDPWPLRGSGRRGNVYLLQGEGGCVPCKQEGCDRHLNSFSECLTKLDSRRVVAAVATMLDTSPMSNASAIH
jgi:heptosyltransferase-3